MELVSTFADQAVIAIENVRLFDEVQARTRELIDSLEQQTATGEMLSAISGSTTDTGPVFDPIVRNLLRLFGSSFAFVGLLRDGMIEVVGLKGEPGFEKLAQRLRFHSMRAPTSEKRCSPDGRCKSHPLLATQRPHLLPSSPHATSDTTRKCQHR